MEKDQNALHLAGYTTLSGMLYTIIMQNQAGRPLTPEEMKQAFDDGEKLLVHRIERTVAEYTKLLQQQAGLEDQ